MGFEPTTTKDFIKTVPKSYHKTIEILFFLCLDFTIIHTHEKVLSSLHTKLSNTRIEHKTNRQTSINSNNTMSSVKNAQQM